MVEDTLVGDDAQKATRDYITNTVGKTEHSVTTNNAIIIILNIKLQFDGRKYALLSRVPFGTLCFIGHPHPWASQRQG